MKKLIRWIQENTDYIGNEGFSGIPIWVGAIASVKNAYNENQFSQSTPDFQNWLSSNDPYEAGNKFCKIKAKNNENTSD
ncbi:MAG: hypothetical protein IPI96_15310 [Saprospiraceae bacterium]|nr:hypothetical protein [Saprospiraceae bacterium]